MEKVRKTEQPYEDGASRASKATSAKGRYSNKAEVLS